MDQEYYQQQEDDGAEAQAVTAQGRSCSPELPVRAPCIPPSSRVQFVRRLNRPQCTYTAIKMTFPHNAWKRGMTFQLPNVHPFWTRAEFVGGWTDAMAATA